MAVTICPRYLGLWCIYATVVVAGSITVTHPLRGRRHIPVPMSCDGSCRRGACTSTAGDTAAVALCSSGRSWVVAGTVQDEKQQQHGPGIPQISPLNNRVAPFALQRPARSSAEGLTSWTGPRRLSQQHT